MAINYLLSVGVVVYSNDQIVLEKMLGHLDEAVSHLSGEVKVFLIDNHPSQKNMKFFHSAAIRFEKLHIEVIPNSLNTGYGAGNNLAIVRSKAQYHLVLNPDVFLDKFALQNAIRYMEQQPKVGLLCPAIFGMDGERQFVHRKDPTFFDLFLRSFAPRWLKSIFRDRMLSFELRHLDWDQEQDIPSPSGCCMLFRMEVLYKIKGFDPIYFLYYEDSDIGRQIRQNAEVKYLPTFRVMHLWAREGHRSWRMRWYLIKSGLIYLRKWRC